MAAQGSSPVLVGRTAEMSVLADALAGTRQDGHPALLIGGEAGAGKSRLLAEFQATAPDARVLAGGCLAMGGDELPFTPFATFLRGLVREMRRRSGTGRSVWPPGPRRPGGRRRAAAAGRTAGGPARRAAAGAEHHVAGPAAGPAAGPGRTGWG